MLLYAIHPAPKTNPKRGLCGYSNSCVLGDGLHVLPRYLPGIRLNSSRQMGVTHPGPSIGYPGPTQTGTPLCTPRQAVNCGRGQHVLLTLFGKKRLIMCVVGHLFTIYVALQDRSVVTYVAACLFFFRFKQFWADSASFVFFCNGLPRVLWQASLAAAKAGHAFLEGAMHDLSAERSRYNEAEHFLVFLHIQTCRQISLLRSRRPLHHQTPHHIHEEGLPT